MIILGVDPGVATTGYGVIKIQDRKLVHIANGIISTKAHTRQQKRLKQINSRLKKIINIYKPAVIAVESLFMCKNVKTAMQVSEARGVILLTIAQAKIRLKEFTPLQVKQALTGYGRADKHQIQRMVKVLLLQLESVPKPDDAADGLAIAICCAQSNS